MRLAALLCVLAIAPMAEAQGSWRARLPGERELAELGSTVVARRARAARALGSMGARERVLPQLLASLETEGSVEVRAAILEALARRADPMAIDALASRLRTAGEADREGLLRALGAIDDPRAVSLLLDRLCEERGAPLAIELVVEHGERAVPGLLAHLSDAECAVGAARALGRIGDPRAVAGLAGLAAHGDEAPRIAAVEALRALGDAAGREAVLALLDDPRPHVEAAALGALEVLGAGQDAERVAPLCEASDASVRAAAWGARIALDPAGAADALEALAEDDALVRSAIRAALVRTRSPALREALARLAPEDAEALSALAALEDGAGIDALVALARSLDRDLALGLALRRWPAHASRDEALATLTNAPLARALARDPSVRQWARAAIASADRAERIRGAYAIAALGDAALGDAVLSALDRERDPGALGALAVAARSLHLAVPGRTVSAQLARGHTLGALALVPLARLDGASRRALSEAIGPLGRAPDPTLRAAALDARATLRGRDAMPSLLEHLDDEASWARVVAARALLRVAREPGDSERLAHARRVARDERVRDALRAGAQPARGDEVLVLRVGPEPRPAALDVVLADGRVLVLPPTDDGVVLVPDVARTGARVSPSLIAGDAALARGADGR